MALNSDMHALLVHQVVDWPLAERNYAALSKVQSKEVKLSGGSMVVVQFNPERIVSSAAKVDVQSIKKRPCFLCGINRPTEQKGADFGRHLEVLVNPFPIFPKHFTIPLKLHQPQLLRSNFGALIKLISKARDFVFFYNGPKCGASAPDHFHFQAGNKGFLPIENDFESGKYAQKLGDKEGVDVFVWKQYHRGVISLVSDDEFALMRVFERLFHQLGDLQPLEAEPMINLLAYANEGRFLVHLFPRVKHRPDCYFNEGEEQILLSPASVDMGGVFITPRVEDFEKISSSDIEQILSEVCLDEKKCEQLAQNLLR